MTNSGIPRRKPVTTGVKPRSLRISVKSGTHDPITAYCKNIKTDKRSASEARQKGATRRWAPLQSDRAIRVTPKRQAELSRPLAIQAAERP